MVWTCIQFETDFSSVMVVDSLNKLFFNDIENLEGVCWLHLYIAPETARVKLFKVKQPLKLK